MSREKELDRLRKDELVAILSDLASQLGEDILLSGNKDDIIARIIEAEGQMDTPDEGEGQFCDTGEEIIDADKGEIDNDAEAFTRIMAIKTFETLVNGEKVLVCKGCIENLPKKAAGDAINEGLAEPV